LGYNVIKIKNKGDVEMKLLLANDIGNDKMKVLEPGFKQVLKIPSAYKRLQRSPDVHETDVKKNISNLLDNLLVNITSKSIKYNGLYEIGERAIRTSEGVRNMDIQVGNKHKSDLPLINTLGYAAASVVQKEFDKKGVLPIHLTADVYMSSAIPASQHTAGTAKYLEDRFTDDTHIVIVYVGNEAVTVQLTFKEVKVTKEGVAALYAIFGAKKDMFVEFVNEYHLDNIDGTFFTESKIMHVDIGSGTTEYVFTVGVNPRPEQCTGERQGVGHAVQTAIELMKDERPGLNINRQQFVKYIEKPDEYSKDHDLAADCLRMARINQVEAISGDIVKKYNITLASEPEIIAVYGGGSIEFKDDMYPEVKEFTDSVDAKLLWIPKEYAVDMNVTGLDALNRNLLFVEEYQEALGELTNV